MLNGYADSRRVFPYPSIVSLARLSVLYTGKQGGKAHGICPALEPVQIFSINFWEWLKVDLGFEVLMRLGSLLSDSGYAVCVYVLVAVTGLVNSQVFHAVNTEKKHSPNTNVTKYNNCFSFKLMAECGSRLGPFHCMPALKVISVSLCHSKSNMAMVLLSFWMMNCQFLEDTEVAAGKVPQQLKIP